MNALEQAEQNEMMVKIMADFVAMNMHFDQVMILEEAQRRGWDLRAAHIAEVFGNCLADDEEYHAMKRHYQHPKYMIKRGEEMFKLGTQLLAEGWGDHIDAEGV